MFSVIFILFLSFCLLSFYAFHDYPNAIIATSNIVSSDNKFYLNDELIGDSNGFCVVLRDEEETEIKLVNGSQEQVVVITNSWRFNISDPTGDDLGLEIVRGNAGQELRIKFGCNE